MTILRRLVRELDRFNRRHHSSRPRRLRTVRPEVECLEDRTVLAPNLNSIAVVQNLNGTLEVFGVGTGGSIHHISQHEPSGSWGEWGNLGSPPGSGVPKQIVVARNQNGTLEVFVLRFSGRVYHKSQLTPSGPWGEWGDLGRPKFTLHTLSAIAVGQNNDGRLEIFGITTGNPSPRAVVHRAQETPAGTWGPWADLGSPGSGPVSFPTYEHIAVGRNLTQDDETNGTLEVFVVARFGVTTSTDYVYRINQNSPGGAWGQWASLGRPPGDTINSLAVGQNLNGTLEVFVTSDQQYTVFRISQLDPAGPWGTWGAISTFVVSPHGLRQVVVARNQTDDDTTNGTLEVFTRDRPTFGMDEVFRANQTSPAGLWGPWGNLGNPGHNTISQIVVSQNLNGTLEVFALRGDFQVYHVSQFTPAGDWGEWATSTRRKLGAPQRVVWPMSIPHQTTSLRSWGYCPSKARRTFLKWTSSSSRVPGKLRRTTCSPFMKRKAHTQPLRFPRGTRRQCRRLRKRFTLGLRSSSLA